MLIRVLLCITMFYKVKQNSFNQIHTDSCFVVDKITGKHKKIDENNYEGENAIYYYDRIRLGVIFY